MKRLLLAFLLLCPAIWAQKFPDLAKTPPMGWNTWNTFASNIHEKLIRETADAMVANGMRDAGYVYIVLDDTWSTKQRDAAGNLVADPQKFPSGMKALGDYLHDRGFKFGIYSCAGTRTCADYPGSWGHEFQDARTFASWGVDYLKYDWCNSGNANPRDAYKRMRDALYAAGRPVVFSLCEWGGSKPWEWAGEVGHLWRTTGDIYDSYDGRKGWEMGWKRIVDVMHENAEAMGKAAGPGHWNDPDMLEVGNGGLTFAESRGHFSLWCLLAAPLMAGNDVRNMTAEIRALLTDREALAINQDPKGRQAIRALSAPSKNIEIWAKELEGGEYAIGALNTGNAPAELTIEWERLWFLKGRYTVRDVWAKKAVGTTESPYKAVAESHDVLLFRLAPAKSDTP